MKKTLTVFAALMLVALAVPHSALAYDFSAVAPSGQMLYYNIVDGAAQVTSQNNDYPYYNSYPTGDLAIPSSVVYNGNTYSVTSIGNGAFLSCSGLTSVTIGGSVTSIGNYAFFYCSGLTSVTIPNSVTSIGEHAFSNCSGLTSVTIPESVTSIGEYAFAECSGLTSVTIPDSVTSIGNSAFSRCSGLTSVTIGGSVTSIGNYAFIYCSGLTSVTIPESVTSIGDHVFAYCYGLTSVTIGGSVTSIGEYAFAECGGLTSVTIPNSVTSIGEYAFAECSGLTSVTIPNTVTSIGNYAFSNVRHIEYYGNASGAPWGAFSMNGVTEGDFVFSSVTHDTLIVYIGTGGDVVIPDSVTSIGNMAFYYCSGLTSVTIPESVTSIGYGAFAECSGLTSVTIPNTVTSIGEAAFWGCSGLTSVIIPNSVTNIGNSAFYYCSGLTSVTIPNSVTSIGYGAFYECSGLTSLTIGESVSSIGSYAFSSTGFSGGDTIFILAEVPPAITSTTFEGVPTNVIIRVPCGTLEDYQEADYWNNFTRISEDPSCYTLVTAVPNNAAYGSVSGSGTYTVGDTANIAAMPYNGYAFTGWADGNTDNPRLVLVSGDTTYTANFAPAVLEPVHDTTIVTVVDTVTLTEYVQVHDTTVVTLTDTLWLTLYDTVYITDTIIIHDTVYVSENGIDDVQTASIRLYQRDGQIVVEDADGGVLPEVVVYDAVGRKMETALAGGAPAYQFEVPASGVYLVKIGDRPARRIVVIR